MAPGRDGGGDNLHGFAILAYGPWLLLCEAEVEKGPQDLSIRMRFQLQIRVSGEQEGQTICRLLEDRGWNHRTHFSSHHVDGGNVAANYGLHGERARPF